MYFACSARTTALATSPCSPQTSAGPAATGGLVLAAPQQPISHPASRISAAEPCIGLRAQHACGAGCAIAIATGTKIPAGSNISSALAVSLCTFLIKEDRSSIGYNPEVLQIIPAPPAVTKVSIMPSFKKGGLAPAFLPSTTPRTPAGRYPDPESEYPSSAPSDPACCLSVRQWRRTSGFQCVPTPSYLQ